MTRIDKTTLRAGIIAVLMAGWGGGVYAAGSAVIPGIGPDGEWQAPSRINAEGEWEMPHSIGPDGEWRPSVAQIQEVREIAASKPAVPTKTPTMTDACGIRGPGYSCSAINGADVGAVLLCGDPVKVSFSQVRVNGLRQSVRPGVTSPLYLYLHDLRTEARTFALEIVNYPSSYEAFQMSVYGPDHIVLGSRRIARYACSRIKL